MKELLIFNPDVTAASDRLLPATHTLLKIRFSWHLNTTMQIYTENTGTPCASQQNYAEGVIMVIYMCNYPIHKSHSVRMMQIKHVLQACWIDKFCNSHPTLLPGFQHFINASSSTWNLKHLSHQIVISLEN